MTERVRVIDSHTGGEPTRVVLEGIDLRGETMAERREDLRTRWDEVRSGIVREPRGSEVWVGAVLTPPVTPHAVTGVVFFTSVGPLGMCGHGTIGVVETLRWLGRLGPGHATIDTPVGEVSVELRDSGEVAVRNVLSYRLREGIRLDVEGIGPVVGDLAFGGNWFFVVHEPSFDIGLSHAGDLIQQTWRIRRALRAAGIFEPTGAEIDHVEISGPSSVGDSRNFVLCPGGSYDRSPCGTGTSAKMACLHARGELDGQTPYRQESVTGSVFEGSVEPVDGGVIPTIVGRAYVTAESTIFLDAADPLRWGIRP